MKTDENPKFSISGNFNIVKRFNTEVCLGLGLGVGGLDYNTQLINHKIR